VNGEQLGEEGRGGRRGLSAGPLGRFLLYVLRLRSFGLSMYYFSTLWLRGKVGNSLVILIFSWMCPVTEPMGHLPIMLGVVL